MTSDQRRQSWDEAAAGHPAEWTELAVGDKITLSISNLPHWGVPGWTQWRVTTLMPSADDFYVMLQHRTAPNVLMHFKGAEEWSAVNARFGWTGPAEEHPGTSGWIDYRGRCFIGFPVAVDESMTGSVIFR